MPRCKFGSAEAKRKYEAYKHMHLTMSKRGWRRKPRRK